MNDIYFSLTEEQRSSIFEKLLNNPITRKMTKALVKSELCKYRDELESKKKKYAEEIDKLIAKAVSIKDKFENQYEYNKCLSRIPEYQRDISYCELILTDINEQIKAL